MGPHPACCVSLPSLPPLPACLLQVTLLSSGYMMYSGEREGLVPWFTQGCGYAYDPPMHGLASDWVMDLVNVGFTKPEVRGGLLLLGAAAVVGLLGGCCGVLCCCCVRGRWCGHGCKCGAPQCMHRWLGC